MNVSTRRMLRRFELKKSKIRKVLEGKRPDEWGTEIFNLGNWIGDDPDVESIYDSLDLIAQVRDMGDYILFEMEFVLREYSNGWMYAGEEVDDIAELSDDQRKSITRCTLYFNIGDLREYSNEELGIAFRSYRDWREDLIDELMRRTRRECNEENYEDMIFEAAKELGIEVV